MKVLWGPCQSVRQFVFKSVAVILMPTRRTLCDPDGHIKVVCGNETQLLYAFVTSKCIFCGSMIDIATFLVLSIFE